MKCFLVWILWHWFTFDVWLNTCLHFCISFMYLSKVNTRCFKIVYLGPTFFYHWLISRVSLQYVFSDGEWGDGCDEILCHIPYMSNISLQYEFSDVEKDLNSGERLCHGLSPIWILWCWVRCEQWIKALPHLLHLYGFSPGWVRWCTGRLRCQLKALPHSVHLQGLSPVWIRWCWVRSE